MMREYRLKWAEVDEFMHDSITVEAKRIAERYSPEQIAEAFICLGEQLKDIKHELDATLTKE